MALSLQDINIDLTGANSVEELRSKTQKILTDLLAILQSQPPILVLTSAAARVPAGTQSGTIVFQLTDSTTTNPYGTLQTRMYYDETKTLIPQYT